MTYRYPHHQSRPYLHSPTYPDPYYADSSHYPPRYRQSHQHYGGRYGTSMGYTPRFDDYQGRRRHYGHDRHGCRNGGFEQGYEYGGGVRQPFGYARRGDGFGEWGGGY